VPRRVLIVFALAALGFFAYAWLVQPSRPTLGAVLPSVNRVIDPPAPGDPPTAAYLAQVPRLGWYAGSADQLNYAREARALAHGRLPGSQYDYKRHAPKPSYQPTQELSDYAYPLGYPTLGALSILVGVRGDPFLVPDALLFVAIVVLAFRLGSRFLRRPWNWLYIVALAVATPLTRYVTQPWNTTTTILAVLAVLWVTAEGSDSWANAALVAGTAALCFSSRIVDVVWPLGILAVWCLLTRRVPRRILTVTAVVLVVTAGLMMWTQYRVFGDAFTVPYSSHNNGAGIGLSQFDITRIPRDAWNILVSGRLNNGARTPASGVDSNPLLREWPWLLLAPVGFLVARRRRDLRAWLISGCVVSVVASLYYFAYSSATGDDLQYGVFRFFVAWFPLWALLAVMAIPGALAPEKAAAEP
jgi:hypothetical protein